MDGSVKVPNLEWMLVVAIFNWYEVGWVATQLGRPGRSTTLSVKNLSLPIFWVIWSI